MEKKGDSDPDQGYHSHSQLHNLEEKCLKDNSQQQLMYIGFYLNKCNSGYSL